MFKPGGTVHDTLSSYVQEDDTKYPAVHVWHASAAMCAVMIFLAAIVGLFMWFIPPPDILNYTLESVNASVARTPHPDCFRWDDHTVYGAKGLKLPQFSDIAQFSVKKPLLGDEMFKQVYELKCTAQDVKEAVTYGSTAALIEDYSGGQYQVGAFEVPCVHPSDKDGMRAVNLGADMAINCDAGKGRADTLYQAALLSSGAKAPPMTWGADCKVRNIRDAKTARFVMFRQWWHWPKHPTWPGFYSSVYIFCDGLEGVLADFAGVFSRNMTDAEQNILTTTKKLCAIDDGSGNCLLSYQQQTWGKDSVDPTKISTEWTKVMFDEIDCSNRFAQPGDFQQTSTLCANEKALHPNSTTFFRQFAASNPSFSGDVSPVVTMFDQLTGSPWAASPADISYMQLACPGRSSMLESILHTGSSNGLANEKTLNATIAMFQSMTPYTFQCTVKVPPTFSDRLSTVWPYIEVLQTIVMAYGLRYIYLGLLSVTNAPPEPHHSLEASDEEDH